MMVPVDLHAQTIGSLLVRYAWQRADSPASLAKRLGLGWAIWKRDLDRSLSDLAISRVSLATGLEDNQVRLMTLNGLLGEAGIPTRRSGFQQWITPIGVYHRRRLRYGQLYCSGCLQVGPKLLRMEWRFGTSWICGIHGVPLQDSCPHCDAPFAPFRDDSLMLGRCDRCISDLTQWGSQMAPRAERLLQLRVRSLWEDALAGNAGPLAVFHQALVTAATAKAAFRGAGEPWTYWRLAERRELLVTVAAETLVQDKPTTPSARDTAPRTIAKPSRRRCRGLPRDPAARAEALLSLAARVKFSRRPKARIAKDA